MKSILLIGFITNLLWLSQTETNSNHEAAFEILQEKCNVCHQKKRSVVFTEGNMETWAEKIHTQVFVKKRMPKGKKFPLTAEEYDTLKTWLMGLNIPKKN